jgi:hypothetical protein
MPDLSLNSLEGSATGVALLTRENCGVRLMAGFGRFSNRLDSVASAADSDNLSVME